MTRRTVPCFQIVRKTIVFLVVPESAADRRKCHEKTRCGNQSKVAWRILSFLAGRVAMLEPARIRELAGRMRIGGVVCRYDGTGIFSPR